MGLGVECLGEGEDFGLEVDEERRDSEVLVTLVVARDEGLFLAAW